jgi:cell wall-associated NlpC family hydrolase
MIEDTRRATIVAEAISWLGTPYHHEARLKGHGVDCAMLVAEVYRAAGLIPKIDAGHYPPDWHLHRDEERYLDMVLRHAQPTDDPKPGDVALWRIGRTWSHGAIIVDPGWPHIIHALKEAGKVIRDFGTGGRLANRSPKFLTLRNLHSSEGEIR